MQMAVGLVMSQNAVRDELYSARPDAPTVPHVERRLRARAVRLALAAAVGRTTRASLRVAGQVFC